MTQEKENEVSAPALAGSPNIQGGGLDRPSRALEDVAAERRRQIEAEGWTPEHDDQHNGGQLALAGGWYALNSVYRGAECIGNVADSDSEANKLFGPRHGHGAYAWPWDMTWWKPGEPRRDLVKAAALILAEIERLDRASAPNTTAPSNVTGADASDPRDAIIEELRGTQS